jgi:serine/threonine protein kinase
MAPIEDEARSIFLDAFARDPGQWPAFLDEACGDRPDLRAKVDQLLQAHQAMGSIQGGAAHPPAFTVDDAPIAESPGTTIGPYRLLEIIGDGGFGVVFAAEQTEPVRRKVALKVLKPGMDTRQVVARFEAERQALAIMDHPNVAKVFDGGATASGRPYFVMELVKGAPITEFCDQNHLSPRQRLDLFTSVCQAVQHAHQKGIVHRDLKPSNVLVSRHDTTPIVKVIDFGVAKALGQELTEKTLFTGIAQIIGTPLYMSPEQAGMSDLDVDTRSDIYSLGVLLYELLTGTTPFTKERFKKAAFDEIRRIIREEEPPRPSTRLSGSTESLASISAQRQMEPAKLTKLVRGDLDWIVMKCLEKDRGRRYATASGLAADVHRYLADEPVQACPPSTWYRIRKFARRNKGPVIAATVIVLCLVAGMIGTTAGLVWAVRERDEKARALTAETQARVKAMAALRDMTDEIVENQMARNANLSDENKEFLRKTIAHYEGLAALTADDAESRLIRAEGNLRVGRLRYRLGEFRDAEAADHAAVALYGQLAAEFPNVAEHRYDLGRCHNNLAVLSFSTGRLADAEAEFREAVAHFKPLAAEFPTRIEFRQDLARAQSNMGVLFFRTSRLSDSESAMKEALAIRKQLAGEFPTRPEFRGELAQNHSNLGLLFKTTGRTADAETAYRDALAIQKKLVADFNTRLEFRRELATGHNNLGTLLHDTGRLADAEAAYREALAIQQQLVADFPARHELRQELARSHNNLGNLFRATDRLADAEAAYRDALAIQKKLVADFPTRQELRRELAISHNGLGSLLDQTGRLIDAEAAFRDALAIQKKLVADFPESSEFRSELAAVHNNLGELFRRTNKPADAEAAYRDALAVQRKLAAEFPDQPDLRNQLARTLGNLALFASERRDFAAVRTHLAEAQPHHQAALKANGQNPVYRQLYRDNLGRLVVTSAGLLDRASAIQVADKMRDLGWDPPVNAYDAALALAGCIPAVQQLKPEAQAAAETQFYGDETMKMLKDAVAKGFRDAADLKQNKELDPLRGREDFKKLLAELEANKK